MLVLCLGVTLAMHADVAPKAFADAEIRWPRIASVRLGFHGAYKLGCWTQLQVEFESSGGDLSGVHVEAIVPDSDGVATIVATPFSSAASTASNVTVNLFIRYGQDAAPLTVRLVDDAKNMLAERMFIPSIEPQIDAFPMGLPATNKLVVTLGAEADLAASLTRAEQAGSTDAATAVRSVLLETADDLPVEWYGYEGVDTVIISGAKLKLFADRELLAPRIAALNRWVELGGRLIVFCGAATAPELLANDGPLAPLVPARFSGEVTPIPEFTSLENFSGAANQLPKSELRNFRVPRMVDVEPTARVLAAGPGGLPLVIRARRELGEVTFIAVDPEARPFVDWSDRPGLLRQSLQWPAPAVDGAAKRAYAGPATADLTNQLRSALDQQFTGVDTASFALVALLTIGYIALVGPGDYFFVRRVLKRMELTWLTFPLLVVATSAGAYALAYRMKGNELRVNQVEIVDVDVTTGAARGTVWTHVFNPEVARYTLTLAPRFAGKITQSPPERAGASPPPASATTLQPPAGPAVAAATHSLQPSLLTAWLGVPGFGLGAMQGHRGEGSLFERGYALADNLGVLEELPIEQWSTKSLTARWSARVGDTLDAELRAVGDDQLEGRITNRTGIRLEDCVLMLGGWAYQLPPLNPDAVAVIDDSIAPRTIKTTLTSVAAGDDSKVRTADDGTVLFDGLSTDVARLTKLMMFYEIIGGQAYAGAPNRYQGFIDLSRLLKGESAILLARAPADAGSHWINTSSTDSAEKTSAPLASEHDRRWVYYRFVIPLEAANQATPKAEPPKVYGPSPLPAQ